MKRRALQVLVGKPTEGLTPLRGAAQRSASRTANNIDSWVTASQDSSYTVASARANLEIVPPGSRSPARRPPARPSISPSSFARASNPQSAVPGALGAVSNAGVIGLQLSVPIYSGGLTQSRVREALANRDRAEQDLDNTKRTVAQAVRTNFLNVTSGIAQVRALEQALASTQSQLDSTILGRDVGVRTSVDVLNAQQAVFQTRRDPARQALQLPRVSNLRLKAAAGVLTEDADLEDVNRDLARG